MILSLYYYFLEMSLSLDYTHYGVSKTPNPYRCMYFYPTFCTEHFSRCDLHCSYQHENYGLLISQVNLCTISCIAELAILIL